MSTMNNNTNTSNNNTNTNTFEGIVHFPPYNGWSPAGTLPGNQFRPLLTLDGLLFPEPVKEDDGGLYVELSVDGGPYRRHLVVLGEVISEDDDGSYSRHARVVKPAF